MSASRRGMGWRLGLGSVAMALVALGTFVAVGSAGPYVATLDGSPASPAAMPAAIADFDIQVHSRDNDTWFQLEPIDAQHGADCSAPPATHPNTSYEGSVFQCRNHLMTALNSSGYGVIYLTPDQLFDFSNGGSVQWEMSTERMSSRDWWDVLITPWDNNMSVPLLSDLSQGVDLQGAPLNVIHIGGDNGEGAPILTVVRNGVEQKYQNGWEVPPVGYDVVSGTNEAATRQTFRFSIANGRMMFERLASPSASALVFWDVAATVPFSSGIVQIGHHSYNPTKDNSGVPATRHWDNFSINPAVPFTLIKATQRFTQGGTVSFNQPAPANAFLRFTGICRVSIDGVPVQRVPDYDRWFVGYHPEHSSSYFVPITQGKSSVDVSFSDDDWYQGPCIAKDFSIWSKDPSSSNPPSNSPTPTTTTTTSTTSLSGQVVAEGRASAAGIRVELSPGGRWVATGPNGTFRFDGLTPGQTFTVTARLPGFVDAHRANVQVVAGSNVIGKTVLKAGDINDDGSVTVTDVSLIAGIYGSIATTGMPHDQNGNGAIDVTDVSLAAGNYGLIGPTNW